MIRDSQVKFKVSQTNIFQENKKLQIIIISQAQIYTKIPQAAQNFVKNEYIISQSVVFSAVQIEFSWSPSIALPWTCCREENHSCLRPQLHSRITIEKLIQTLHRQMQCHVLHLLI